MDAAAASSLIVSLFLLIFTFTAFGSAQQQCTYEINVFTGDRPGAGTDADVYMRLSNGRGASLNFQLDRPGNIFEANGVDKFVTTNACVGRICKVEVTQDGKYPSSSWYVKGISVSVKQGNRCISSESFTINEWVKDPIPERAGSMKYHWLPLLAAADSPLLAAAAAAAADSPLLAAAAALLVLSFF